MSGRHDEGDLVIRANGRYHVVECKNVKTWSNSVLNGFMAEADAERVAFAARRSIPLTKASPVLFLKRANVGWSGSYVMVPMTEYIRLLSQDG